MLTILPFLDTFLTFQITRCCTGLLCGSPYWWSRLSLSTSMVSITCLGRGLSPLPTSFTTRAPDSNHRPRGWVSGVGAGASKAQMSDLRAAMHGQRVLGRRVGRTRSNWGRSRGLTERTAVRLWTLFLFPPNVRDRSDQVSWCVHTSSETDIKLKLKTFCKQRRSRSRDHSTTVARTC